MLICLFSTSHFLDFAFGILSNLERIKILKFLQQEVKANLVGSEAY